MLKYTEDGRGRIFDGLKRYSRIVAQARTRGMNERDTSDIVKAMLSDMLGFDPFFDVTADVSACGPLCHYAVIYDGKLRLLLVVNPIGVPPVSTQLLRFSGAASPPYADWVLVTNADVWACYRVGVGTDRHAEIVFRVSLLDTGNIEDKAKFFGLLSKEAVAPDLLRQYWEETRVLNPGRIASLLLSDESLSLLRREIQRTANYRIDKGTLYEVLIREVLSPDALAARIPNDVTEPRSPECYAYVRNPNDPATWRFLYRNSDGTPNPDLLTLAVSDVTSEGRIVGIPADDIPLVKQRLRQAYLELGIMFEHLPPGLKT